jgi:hypothetical protein
MAGMDLRSFTYALEPVRQRKHWEFDAALARLANLRLQMVERETERHALMAEYEARGERAARAWAIRPDPDARRRLVGYLALLQQRMADIERELAALVMKLDLARRDCAAKQKKLDVIEEHRSAALRSYTSEEHRKLATRTDQDWTSRTSRQGTGS